MDGFLPFVGLPSRPADRTRKGLWRHAHARIVNSGLQYEYDEEIALVGKLMSGLRWGEMVPQEWRDIYGALWDESQREAFPVDERERVNIEKDVHRTFGVFTRNRLLQIQFRLNEVEYSESLKAVLLAATHERRYCQGFNFLAALFILSENSARESFTLLCFLLRQRHLQVLFNPSYSCLLEYMKVFERRLRQHNRAVYRHFRSVGFEPICYAIEWFTTCFIVSSPPSGELSSCVIDLIMLGLRDAMLRVGLAVLDALEPFVVALDLEDLQVQFKQLTRQVDVVDVMSRALSIGCGERGGALIFSERSRGGFLSGFGLPSLLSSPPQSSNDEDHSSNSSSSSSSSSSSESDSDDSSPSNSLAVARAVPSCDLLASMAANIDKMVPSERGEFIDTIDFCEYDEQDFAAEYGAGAGAGDRDRLGGIGGDGDVSVAESNEGSDFGSDGGGILSSVASVNCLDRGSEGEGRVDFDPAPLALSSAPASSASASSAAGADNAAGAGAEAEAGAGVKGEMPRVRRAPAWLEGVGTVLSLGLWRPPPAPAPASASASAPGPGSGPV